MKLFDYLDIISATLELKREPQGEWRARILSLPRDGLVCEGGTYERRFVGGNYGCGRTQEQALINLVLSFKACPGVNRKRELIFRSPSDNTPDLISTRYIGIPESLEAER